MKETNKALGLYEQYASLGINRSLAKLAQLLGKPRAYTRYLEELSVAHNWQVRVRQYDAEQAEIIQSQLLQEQKEKLREWEEQKFRMNQEHALLGRTHALRAAKQIQDLIDARKFGSQAAVTLFKFATDLERVARGAETSNTKIQTDGPLVGPNTVAFNLTQLTPEQLDRLELIAQELEQSEE